MMITMMQKVINDPKGYYDDAKAIMMQKVITMIQKVMMMRKGMIAMTNSMMWMVMMRSDDKSEYGR